MSGLGWLPPPLVVSLSNHEPRSPFDKPFGCAQDRLRVSGLGWLPPPLVVSLSNHEGSRGSSTPSIVIFWGKNA